eukprot:2281492-Pyramimonas_sp.AAC.1
MPLSIARARRGQTTARQGQTEDHLRCGGARACTPHSDGAGAPLGGTQCGDRRASETARGTSGS